MATISWRAGALAAALAGAAANLVACGGGGGGAGDRTAPRVTSVAPADGAEDLPRDAAMSAVFSERMDPASIDGSSMQISPAVDGTVGYDVAALRARFTPAAPLAIGTTYTVTLTTGCTDLAGNPLASSVSWSFTTGQTSSNAWAPVGGRASPAAASSEDPTMLVVDHAPAVGYRHSSDQARLSRWSGAAWSTESDPTGGNCNGSIYSAPAFASNGSEVYLAYSRSGNPASPGADFYDRIMVQRWTPAGGWSAMNGGAEVSNPWTEALGGADATEADVSCRPDGLPVAAWEEIDVGPAPDTEHRAWYAAVTAAGVNRVDAPISRDDGAGGYATDVRTAGVLADPLAGDLGCVYLAQWESHHADGDRTDLYVSYGCDRSYTTLGGSVADDYLAAGLSKPSMVMLGNDVYVAYTRAGPTGSTRSAYVQAYDLSGAPGWVVLGDGPVSAFGADHYDSANPHLIAADGTLYLAWEEESTDDGPFVFTARFDWASSSWIVDPTPLNVDVDDAAQDPTLAYDPEDGYLYVAFEENTDGWPHVFVKRKRHLP